MFTDLLKTRLFVVSIVDQMHASVASQEIWINWLRSEIIAACLASMQRPDVKESTDRTEKNSDVSETEVDWRWCR